VSPGLAASSATTASQEGRLDVVQVRLGRNGGEQVVDPVFRAFALLSVLTEAEDYVVVADAETGLAAGTDVEVTLYR